MEKTYYAKHISPKKGSWLKTKPEEGIDKGYERTDGLARIYRIGLDFTGVVPVADHENKLSYANLGPFKSLKLARRAIEKYLHDFGFVVYREDVIQARKGL